jgi:hypothetical protein
VRAAADVKSGLDDPEAIDQQEELMDRRLELPLDPVRGISDSPKGITESTTVLSNSINEQTGQIQEIANTASQLTST